VLFGPALRARQTGGVHDVVRNLDESLTGQDWSVADSADGIFDAQHVFPERCDYSTPAPKPQCLRPTQTATHPAGIYR
jgi:hypothetical protein